MMNETRTAKYNKCKLIVKRWENNFYKTKGRIPSKYDIREADKNIRDAYRMYFKLKTAALEESLSEVFDDLDTSDISNEHNVNDITCEQINDKNKLDEETEEVWGKHLNKSQTKITCDKIIPSKKDEVNSSFTKKLFANSKFTKRNPRKSFASSKNDSQIKSKISNDSLISDKINYQPDIIESQNDNLKKSLIESSDTSSFFQSADTLLISSTSSQISTQSLNVIDQMLNSTTSISLKVDKKWLDRVAINSGIENISSSFDDKTYSSDDDVVVSDSDEEIYNKAKRRKLFVGKETVTKTKNSCNVLEQAVENSIQYSSMSAPKKFLEESVKNISTSNLCASRAIQSLLTKEDIESVDTKQKINNCENVKNKDFYDYSSSEEEDHKSTVKRKRLTKKETVKNSSKRKSADKVVNRKTRSKIKSDEAEDQEILEAETYEIEYSIRPPPSTVPRFKDLPVLSNNLPSNENQEKQKLSKENIAKAKLEKKIASGTLNDNFVRLDMKKKLFVRGKKNMNFSKYKKQMWKNKKKAMSGSGMDMSGCDGGVLTCFKCGQNGHFARQCKSQMADKLLPLDAAEELCPYPTLEEASKMARESVLAVHVPNISKTVNTSDNEENKSDDTESVFDDDFEDLLMNADFDAVQSNDDTHLENNSVEQEEIGVQPVYNLNPDGTLVDTPNEVFKALKLFGHSSFRPGQEQAIMRILSGLSSLVTLSTGSGKSLCYQLPAYIYARKSKCVSLVISPLVSLMDDQVSSMPDFLKAACLHTGLTQVQKDKVLKLIDSGDVNILLVSPESVIAGEKSTGFSSFLRKLPSIAFACIDEAHCMSQWSHNFRPSYLMICRVLREKLGVKTILGLTATSTYATSSSIVQHLQIPDGPKGVISDVPLPDNLYLSISHDRQRDNALRNLLISEPYSSYNSIIIYCTRREECERIARYLRTSIRTTSSEIVTKKYKSLSSQAEPYHAGLSASKRRTVQKAFMNGYLRIVIATVAFGMGINKSDIRAVIHYNMPRNFESYVQEVGRAGRDGLPAHCHLFLDSEGNDQNELRRHIFSNSIDRHVIRKLLQKIFVSCGCTKICPRHEVAFSVDQTVQVLDIPEENISTLLCYLELHEKRYIEVLTPAYTVCKVISYGGAQEIRKAAKDCPPLAMAMALHQNCEAKNKKDNILEFPVIDVAASIGWDSGICKHKLKNLEWNQENGLPKRSTLTIQFSNLGFRLRAPGNLSPSELDEVLDNLFAKVKEQEMMSLLQLQVVHSTLTSVTVPCFLHCLPDDYSPKSVELKTNIRKYFNLETPLKNLEILEQNVQNEGQIISDTRFLIAMYQDNNFTGRAVARIFHGIQSPNYPAVIWGKCKFWRSHLNSDFNKICQIATAEILKFR